MSVGKLLSGALGIGCEDEIKAIYRVSVFREHDWHHLRDSSSVACTFSHQGMSSTCSDLVEEPVCNAPKSPEEFLIAVHILHGLLLA